MPNDTCPCGSEIVQPQRGRRRKFCTTCRPENPRRAYTPVKRTDTPCAYCGEGTSRPKFCSDVCYVRAKVSVPCSECGGWAYAGPGRRAAPDVRCKDCKAATRGDRPTVCAHCGDSFEARRRGGGWTKHCSKSCARKAEFAAGGLSALAEANRKRILDPTLTPEERQARKGELARRTRRARLAGVEREPYTTTQIAERDGFRCGLCRRKVDMAKAWPHPRSASVDHIVPLSRGGNDTRANVQLAHLDCNLSKHNRIEEVQPLLIG